MKIALAFPSLLAIFGIVVFGFITTPVFVATASTGISNAPLIGITSTAEPLTLPNGGESVAFIYTITNLGAVPLNDVTVSDDQCTNMSAELGDTNGNHLLDPSEVWIYNCTTVLAQTTANTAMVTAYADGQKATASETITVNVGTTSAKTTSSPGLPNGGSNPGMIPGLPNNGTNPNTLNITLIIWGVLGGILLILIIVFLVIRKKR